MTTFRTLAAAVALLLVACAGAQKTGKREMTQIAKNAEPPPDVSGPAKPIERTVSTEAKEDFGSAVAFFNEQEKLGWNAERCGAAAGKFKSVAGEHDKMVEAWFNAGVSYQKCGDVRSAEDMYKKALSINAAHGGSLSNLGEIYFRGGNESVGRQYFEKAITADPQILGARNNLAWILYNQLRHTSDNGARKRLEDEALGHLSRVLAVDNDNVFAYTLMALIYLEGSDRNKSRLDVARLLLEEGKKRDAKYAQLYNAYGLLELKRKNLGKALENFRKALEMKPGFVEAQMNVSQLVLSFRKYDEAEQSFRQILQSPGLSKEMKYDATVGLGIALRGLGSINASSAKIDEAASAYEEALKLMPDRGDAYYNLGLLWKDFRTNNEDPKANKDAYIKAKGYFNQFLGRAGGNEDMKQEAKDNIGDCDKVIRNLDQAIEIMRQQPPAAAGGK